MATTRVWVKFEFLSDSSTGRTKIWEVMQQIPKDVYAEHAALGSIKWFGRWRKYAFFPENDTVYEWDCLRVIAEFCENKTKEHRRLNP
jgi:hypothetical protein